MSPVPPGSRGETRQQNLEDDFQIYQQCDKWTLTGHNPPEAQCTAAAGKDDQEELGTLVRHQSAGGENISGDLYDWIGTSGYPGLGDFRPQLPGRPPDQEPAVLLPCPR